MKNMKKISAISIFMFLFLICVIAQERPQATFGNRRVSTQLEQQQQMPDENVPPIKPPQMVHPIPPPLTSPSTISAYDWANAWVAAKEAKIQANKVTFYLTSSTGPSILSGEKSIFDIVSLKAFGNVLLIIIEKTPTAEGSFIIIRADELLKIEVQNVKQ